MRRLAACVALAVAVPAAAYLPPATAILKRVAQHREGLKLSALEVRGTLAVQGEAAQRLAAATGLPLTGGGVTVPATLSIKVPGRCRLELDAGASPAQRPAVWTRQGRVAGQRALDTIGAARALVEAACTLLGERTGGAEPERALAGRLADRGVDLREVALGRQGGRVAWVIGGRAGDDRPQAWIDKVSFEPVRLRAELAGAARDVRLLDFGSPVGGDAFPRAAEVWSGQQIEARFSTEKVTHNPRLPDSAFP